jgi:hypothetical protein
MTQNQPPRFASWLLNFLLPERHSEALIGDLVEEYSTERRSRFWYWTQTLQSLLSLGTMTVVRLILAIAICIRGEWWAVGALDRTAMDLCHFSSFTVFPMLIIDLAMCVMADVAGGYVTALFVKRRSLVPAMLCGLVSVVLMAFQLGPAFFVSMPIWYSAILMLEVVPAAALGGYLHLRRA